jgi:hypothetical protein
MTSKIVCTLLFVLCTTVFCSAQKEIGNIESHFIDSSGKVMRTFDPVQLNVKYKSKGKSKMNVHVAAQVVDTYEIVDVKITDEYISLLLFCETEDFILTTMRFYLNENKLETITSDEYSHITTGTGLKYRISKKVKGTKTPFPERYVIPPM